MRVYHFSAEAIARGWNLCLENARELVEEAELLMREGRVPRVVSLSTLAWEELGKAVLIAESASLQADDLPGWATFQRQFLSHEMKLRTMGKIFVCCGLVTYAYAKLRKLSPEDLDLRKDSAMDFFRDMQEFAALAMGMGSPGINQMKQQGFYVDLVDDTFFGPARLEKGFAEVYVRLPRHTLGEANRVCKSGQKLAEDIAEVREAWQNYPGEVAATLEHVFAEWERLTQETMKTPRWLAVRPIVEGISFSVRVAFRFTEVFGLALAK